MTKDDLKKVIAGDIGLCRPDGEVWKAIISFFEWMNIPQEALEYCHTLIFQTPAMIWEMTSPRSHWIPCSQYDLSRIDVWRLYFPGTDTPLFPDTPEAQAAIDHELDAHLGEAYDYGRDLRFALYGVPARLGLPSVSKWLLTKNAGSGEVCSTDAEDRLTAAAMKLNHLGKLDLLPQFGHGMVMPATWPLSPYIRRVC